MAEQIIYMVFTVSCFFSNLGISGVMGPYLKLVEDRAQLKGVNQAIYNKTSTLRDNT